MSPAMNRIFTISAGRTVGLLRDRLRGGAVDHLQDGTRRDHRRGLGAPPLLGGLGLRDGDGRGDRFGDRGGGRRRRGGLGCGLAFGLAGFRGCGGGSRTSRGFGRRRGRLAAGGAQAGHHVLGHARGGGLARHAHIAQRRQQLLAAHAELFGKLVNPHVCSLTSNNLSLSLLAPSTPMPVRNARATPRGTAASMHAVAGARTRRGPGGRRSDRRRPTRRANGRSAAGPIVARCARQPAHVRSGTCPRRTPLRPRGRLRGGGRLGLRLDVDPPAGETRCEPGVLSLFPDRQRQLVVRDDRPGPSGSRDRRSRGSPSPAATRWRRARRRRRTTGTTSIFSPRSSVTTLRTREPFGPDARADRIDRGLVGPHRDLRAVAGLARDAADLHDAVLDLGHLHLEQPLQQPRVGAADDDLRALHATTNLGDVGLQTLAVAVGLGGHLLGLRQQGLDLARGPAACSDARTAGRCR